MTESTVSPWHDFEETIPPNIGNYICCIWGFSCNQYGNSSEYRELYFDGINFRAYYSHESRYPTTEYDSEGNLRSFFKVIYWLSAPPLKPSHFQPPEELLPNAVQNPLDLEIPSTPERTKFLREIKKEEEKYHTEKLKDALGIPNASQNPRPEKSVED